MKDYATSAQLSQVVAEQLRSFVVPLLIGLDKQLDKRLVRTFLRTLQAMVRLRHNRYGLLLSELGGYILEPSQAPAGTKRLSNLLRSKKWRHPFISRFLWQRASDYLSELDRKAETALVLWDESVVEKPESRALEGLGPVRSSKAARLKRIKPGYFNPPGGRPIFVPGMQWLNLLVVGLKGAPVVAAMRWWSNRGKLARNRRAIAAQLLARCAAAWQQRVIHVFDRGYANSPWLGRLFRFKLRFVLRWKKGQKLSDAKGTRNAWRITQGKRTLAHQLIWDNRRRCWRKVGLVYALVHHPDYPDQPLWLVVARPGRPGQSPWYLLTNEPIDSLEAAWRIVFAYARRWQIEMSFRFAKTVVALESPRLWAWANRLKLMLMVTLLYAFLLSLLDSSVQTLRHQLLRLWGHRTGKRYREVSIPLYRLRAALCRLWLSQPPPFFSSWESPG